MFSCSVHCIPVVLSLFHFIQCISIFLMLIKFFQVFSRSKKYFDFFQVLCNMRLFGTSGVWYTKYKMINSAWEVALKKQKFGESFQGGKNVLISIWESSEPMCMGGFSIFQRCLNFKLLSDPILRRKIVLFILILFKTVLNVSMRG